MGAGAFTAVDQADPESHGGIHELTYEPRASGGASSTIALVGKGLCFDTGGYNVKTENHMMTMKGDMQGSAVALSTLIGAKELGLRVRLKAWLAVTENHISPRGFKPDEVVTALNGTTIEIVNTDAEGRMVLADTLTLATRDKPQLCIDFATLTGAAVRAVGNRVGVVFASDESWHEPIVRVGHASGERLWPFPLFDDYEKLLESKVADTLQCVARGSPDHIVAAIFLKKFVEPKVHWIHVDLSASENDAGLGAADGPFTGFGVQWALDFIRERSKRRTS
jgi:leucyl aminopeptidase